ncbi:hypothetical protein NKG94_45900 [Micromonospora sp. M12]
MIYGAGEPVQPTEYTGNGDVHEFRYGKDLAGCSAPSGWRTCATSARAGATCRPARPRCSWTTTTPSATPAVC